MQTFECSPTAYINSQPDDRKQALSTLRNTILGHLPKGFEEVMNYGMIGYVVPHSLYPAGYHCDPTKPLPFLSIASQKNFIALYHMGLYADPALLGWFKEAYPLHSNTKPDMGKSCIRFKKTEQIPYALLAQLAAKMNPQQWIRLYERVLKK
jgi:hypothetical protein